MSSRLAFAFLLVATLGHAASPERGEERSAARFLSAAKMRSDLRAAPEDIPGAHRVVYAETPIYWTMMIRRTSAGESEVHERVGDIWYVVSGEADVVTDGELTGSHETAPHELRGSGIVHGRTVRMRAGDVLHVPAGVPHWVQRVHKDFAYFIVKVEAP